MVIRMTSTVEVISQAVSPLSGTGRVLRRMPSAGASMAPRASATAQGRRRAAVERVHWLFSCLIVCLDE